MVMVQREEGGRRRSTVYRCSSAVQCSTAGKTTCLLALRGGLGSVSSAASCLAGSPGRFHLAHRPRYWLIIAGLKRQGGTHAAKLCSVRLCLGLMWPP